MTTIVGMKELQSNLAKLESDAGKFSKDAYIAGGKLVESDAKRSIQERSGGEIVTRYRNGGNRYEHQSSKEGDAPNTDTGKLVSSIQTEIAKDGVFVGTGVQYGKYLEFGTNDMDSRPWLIPALNGRKDQIVNLQIEAINKSIRGAANASGT